MQRPVSEAAYAFPPYWKEHFERVREFVAREIPDVDDVHDVVTETGLAVFSEWERKQARGHEQWDPEEFSFKVAKVQIKRFWYHRRRDKGIRMLGTSTDIEALVVFATHDAQHQLDLEDTVKLLRIAFAQLPPSYREVITQHLNDELPFPRPPKITVRLHRARLRLRDLLEDLDP